MLHFLSIAIVMFGLSSAQTSEPLRYVLTDIEKNIKQESFEIKSQDLTPDCPYSWSVSKYALHGGKQEGIEIIKIDNGKLCFDLVPTRGMSIMQASIGDLHLGHKFIDSQVQNQPEEAVEWLVRRDLNLSVTPASYIEVIVERENPYRVTIRSKIKLADIQEQKLELLTEISTVPGTNTFHISDTVTNLGSVEQEFDILYQTNYGKPFITKDSKLISPIRQITPVNKQSISNVSTYDIYNAPSESAEQIFLLKLWADQNEHTKVMLQNNTADNAISMDFSTKQLPFFTLLKKPAALENEYVVSLETGTNFSRNRENEQKLAPNQSSSFDIEFAFYSDTNQVSAVAKEIEAIKANRETKIVTVPQSASMIRLEDIIKAAKTWGPAFQNWYGKSTPDFALIDISGKVHRLSDYRGKNVLVIFWATWCGPCLREIPDLIELRKTVGRDDLAMLAITNENPNLVKRFVAKAKINYDILLDQGTLPMPYNSIKAIPSGFFIDAEGKIKLATVGMVSLKEIKMILQATQ